MSVHTAESVIRPEIAEAMQASLLQHYMNDQTGIMNQWYPRNASVKGENCYYWWQDHVLDVLIDAYERTNDASYAARIEAFSRSLSFRSS
ncbi:hypothetical protein ACFPYJ_31305 [Paenibacillus solisilvae]|uniref:Uncharacterized protein n=1 Tax=Paenibacillus solisilvae TaxID=2486751 RepID=A0ABW0WB57_9BACL